MQVPKRFGMLTNPDKIEIYMARKTLTDRKVGSPVIWQVEPGGLKYQDKGKVLENNHGNLLKFEYWSGFGGYEEKPENYSIITYPPDKINDAEIKFTYTREKIPTEEEYQMFKDHLQLMLEAIKELAEQPGGGNQ